MNAIYMSLLCLPVSQYDLSQYNRLAAIKKDGILFEGIVYGV